MQVKEVINPKGYVHNIKSAFIDTLTPKYLPINVFAQNFLFKYRLPLQF